MIKWLKSLFAKKAAIVVADEKIAAQKAAVEEAKKDSDIDCLARTIWGEARGEGHQGMQAVACVIMNRYRENKWYSKIGKDYSITAVCTKPAQFSCWNVDDPNYEKMIALKPGDALFDECLSIARQAISGELEDFVCGANHYFADYIGKPEWAANMVYCTTIGRHNFYRG